KDSDYHLVLTDGAATMIAEIPDPACVSGGPFRDAIAAARRAFDARYTVDTSMGIPTPWQAANAPVTLTGRSFFDLPHGQIGVAPNAIEVHPVIGICFGQECSGPTGTDFSMSAKPAAVSSTEGAVTTTTVTVSPVGAFAGNVTLTVSGVPAGASA